MNWAIIDTGTFDYAADAWGLHLWRRGRMVSGRLDVARRPVRSFDRAQRRPNSTRHFAQFQWVGEIERRYELWGQPGKLAVTGFLTRGRMGSFADAIALSQATGTPADIAAVRHYHSRGGVSLNLEQQITARARRVRARRHAPTATSSPTSSPTSIAPRRPGLSLNGKQWGRPDDTFGIAGVVNGISSVHQQYLNDGGLGILVGDGMLPHPGPEQIIETYYTLPVSYFKLTLDYQFIVNPAYNRDRGPVSVIGARLHSDF